MYLCVYQARLKLLFEIDSVIWGGGGVIDCVWHSGLNWVVPADANPVQLMVQTDESNHSEKVFGRISTNNIIHDWCV